MTEDPHTAVVESALMAFVTLCIPEMRFDDDAIEDVLTMLASIVFAQPDEVRRSAAMRMIDVIESRHNGSTTLRRMMEPFLA